MQTSFAINRSRGVEGMPMGEREARPKQLGKLPQIGTLVLTDTSEAGNLVITITDDETGQVHSLTVAISGATEATSLDEMLAAWRADSTFNDLASVAEDGSLTFTYTARHGGRAYTVATTPPGSMVVTAAITQVAGGSGLEFGRLVARGATDDTFAAVGATTTVQQIAGALFRTDANHFHSLESDSPTAVDTCEVGWTYPLMLRGRMLVKVEEAVTPASTPYLRRALTSGAGRLGGFRASPAGATQAVTITPVQNMLTYGVAYGYLGIDYVATYSPTDATTSVADAVAGLEDALQETNPSGVTVSAGGTTEATITAAAGTQFDYVRNISWNLDTEAASTVIVIATADVDAIDVSSICEFEDSAAADGLATLRMKMG
jgi:hypothetical protein